MPELIVKICSFSYRKGIPESTGPDGGGFVFDCRCLPNPGREPCFAAKTGKDLEVREYLENEPSVQEFLDYSYALVKQAITNYHRRGFMRLLVAFGCTGGQHRSVYMAERLAAQLEAESEVKIEILHNNLCTTPGAP